MRRGVAIAAAVIGVLAVGGVAGYLLGQASDPDDTAPDPDAAVTSLEAACDLMGEFDEVLTRQGELLDDLFERGYRERAEPTKELPDEVEVRFAWYQERQSDLEALVIDMAGVRFEAEVLTTQGNPYTGPIRPFLANREDFYLVLLDMGDKPGGGTMIVSRGGPITSEILAVNELRERCEMDMTVESLAGGIALMFAATNADTS